MEIEERLNLIKQVGEEIIGEDELVELLKERSRSGKKIIAYDGFEPSGRIHIAQGILRAINVNKLTKAGVHFKFWVADWFALMNNKMDGDLEKIKITGKYFIEVWKACGMDMKNVEFLWASDVMNDSDYWLKVVNIARANTVTRITRCAQIMGRSENESLSAAQIFYPCMQCADIFHLDADIAQLGLDQRKVNVLAREVAPKLGFKKPIVVSHHMLMGLGEPPKSDAKGAEAAIAKKMSKSNPDTAIFMTDTLDDIKRKIKKAYCPEGIIEDNPILEYCKYIIFEKFDSIKIERPEKFGGNLEFSSYEELEKSFSSKSLHPMDLKQAVVNYIDEIIDPVREHFEKDAVAKKLKEQVDGFKVTK
ncbi:tyrosine--tRNA ligase [Candidatus Woesearchaeota archaeon]|nr:tyrosine--tRNA ligase [Candidatus Woesearchaeota archaeon]